MTPCEHCGTELPAESRFCIGCGRPVETADQTAHHLPGEQSPERAKEDMNVRMLYAMVALLIFAGMFPPWETPPGEPPEFLGFHFILKGPSYGSEAVISRFLWTIELVTIAISGFYFSWVFREKR
jgi:predicted nucleic acid-binding Zn ribbon protein